MADPNHFEELRRGGVAGWNAWRTAHPEIMPDLSAASMSGVDLRGINLSQTSLLQASIAGTDLRGADLTEAQLMRADLRKANLQGAKLTKATAFSANFEGATAEGAAFDGALLWFANFTDAKCADADFRDAGLRGTTLRRTDLTGADLTYASLVGTHMDDAILDNCRVYGASVWDLKGNAARQANLVISLDTEPTIAVDDLKIAQFIRLLLTHREIREVIETIGRKAVLILGRFTPERKRVLDAIRVELRKHGYVPLMFDFDKPSDRSRIETVSTLAHLSRFVIADITDAKVVLQELQAIVSEQSTLPVQPIMEKGTELNVVIGDFAGRANFIPDIFEYRDIDDVAGALADHVIAPAEACRARIEVAQAAFFARSRGKDGSTI